MLKPEGCKECPLYTSRGPEESYFSDEDVDIIFLGEAPSNGSILRTKSVKVLLSRLGDLGAKSFGVMDTVRCYYNSPEKILLENVCSPCKQFMTTDLYNHRCRIVVPFGAVALRALLRLGNITRDHGKLYKVKWNGFGLAVFPILHPELVSIESWREEAWKTDFDKLREVLNGISV